MSVLLAKFYNPIVTLVSPDTGATGGGTSVTITGQHFGNGITVTFDGVSATSVVRVSLTSITCDTPAGSLGTADVVVTNPSALDSGTSGNAAFTYAAAVTISSISTSQGDLLGGELVAFIGTGFTGTTSVTFDGNISTEFTEISDTFVVAVAPPGTSGVKDVVVTSAGGASTGGEGLYEYWDPSLLVLSVFNERGDYLLGEYNDIGTTPSTWTSRPSAGPSSSRPFIMASSNVNSPLERLKEPLSDGFTQYLTSDVAFIDTDAWTNSDGTIIVGFNALSASATTTTPYSEPGLVVDDGGGIVLATSFSDAGFGISFFASGWQNFYEPADINKENVGVFKWSGNDGKSRVGDGSFTSLPGINALTALGGSSVVLEKDYSGAVFFDGQIRFVICAQTEISDADCDKVVVWAQNRHGMQPGNLLPEIWSIDSDVVDQSNPKDVTVRGRNFTNTQMVYIGSGLTGGQVIDDNTLVIQSFPALAAGIHTVTVETSAGFTSMVNSLEYFDALDRTAELRWRVGDAGSRTVNGSTEVTSLVDTSGTGDPNMDLVGPGTAPWDTGASAPKLYAADTDFGGEDSMGSDEGADETRNMTSGVYASPLAQPATSYFVFKLVPDRAGTTYFTIPQPTFGGGQSALSFYEASGTGNETSAAGGTNVTFALQDEVAYAACLRYNGATSNVHLNDYFVTAGTGDADVGGEDSVGIGNISGAPGRYKWATRIVVTGDDNTAVRRRMQKWMDNRYQLGRSLRSLGPQLLLEPGNYVGTSPGTWTERRGHDMFGSGGDGPPIDADGVPNFNGGVDWPLKTSGWTLGDWAGLNDNHMFCVFTPTTITSTTTGNIFVNESPFDNDGAAGYAGFYLRVDTGIYYCEFYEWDVGVCKATVSLGASLGTKFVAQGKKEGGYVWIRLGLGPWIRGDACGVVGSGALEATIGSNSYDGIVHAAASWKRVLTPIESERLAVLGATF